MIQGKVGSNNLSLNASKQHGIIETLLKKLLSHPLHSLRYHSKTQHQANLFFGCLFCSGCSRTNALTEDTSIPRNRGGKKKEKKWLLPTQPYALPLGFGDCWGNWWWYGEAWVPFGIERLLTCCPFLNINPPCVLMPFRALGLDATRSACIVWK